MKKLLALLAIVAFSAFADELTIGNNALVNGELNGNAEGWNISGGVGGVDSAGGPGYTFSYVKGTIAQTYAINQALQGTGIQIHGFNYGFEYRFNCGQMIETHCQANSIQDTLNATITIKDNNGDSIYSRYYGLGAKNSNEGNGAYNPNWQSVNTQQRFESYRDLATLGSFTMSITGLDAGNWEGNYGPNVRNAYSRPVYSINQCETNPLSSPSCAGYETAYLTQQCTANPTYSTSCPGYASELFIQQCSISPLSSPACPTYTTAALSLVKTSTATTTTIPTMVDTIVNPVSSTNSSGGSKSVTTNGAANPVPPVKLDSAKTNLDSDGPGIKAESKDKKILTTEENDPKTTREALAQKRREEIKQQAVNKGKELANSAGKAADMQTQMDIQNLVVQAMGYSPAFDVYSKTKLPDTQFYASREVYKGQTNIDSPIGRRLFSGSDLSHQQMVEQQYNLGN